MEKIEIGVHSEIGNLEAVILHNPGSEVENMTPQNAERALYSDILNLSVAKKEYSQLSCLLGKLSSTLYVEDLLNDVLDIKGVKEKLIRKVCGNEWVHQLTEDLLEIDNATLSKQMIEGVPIKRNSLTNYMSLDNYSLRPLHNFFFTRDSAVGLFDKMLISKMASQVRDREALIMQAIFESHPLFGHTTINVSDYSDSHPNIKMEGGDLIVAREDILLCGLGERTSSQGIDFVVNRLKEKKDAISRWPMCASWRRRSPRRPCGHRSTR